MRSEFVQVCQASMGGVMLLISETRTAFRQSCGLRWENMSSDPSQAIAHAGNKTVSIVLPCVSLPWSIIAVAHYCIVYVMRLPLMQHLWSTGCATQSSSCWWQGGCGHTGTGCGSILPVEKGNAFSPYPKRRWGVNLCFTTKLVLLGPTNSWRVGFCSFCAQDQCCRRGHFGLDLCARIEVRSSPPFSRPFDSFFHAVRDPLARLSLL